MNLGLLWINFVHRIIVFNQWAWRKEKKKISSNLGLILKTTLSRIVVSVGKYVGLICTSTFCLNIVFPHNSLKNVNHFFSFQSSTMKNPGNQPEFLSLSVSLSVYLHTGTHTYIHPLISSTYTNNKNTSTISLLKLWNYGSSVMI